MPLKHYLLEGSPSELLERTLALIPEDQRQTEIAAALDRIADAKRRMLSELAQSVVPARQPVETGAICTGLSSASPIHSLRAKLDALPAEEIARLFDRG